MEITKNRRGWRVLLADFPTALELKALNSHKHSTGRYFMDRIKLNGGKSYRRLLHSNEKKLSQYCVMECPIKSPFYL